MFESTGKKKGGVERTKKVEIGKAEFRWQGELFDKSGFSGDRPLVFVSLVFHYRFLFGRHKHLLLDPKNT